MHRLLVRQLRRSLAVDSEDEVERIVEAVLAADTAGLPPETARFLAGLGDLLTRVGAAYDQHERDLTLRNRSLQLSSDELNRANAKLREEAAGQSQALDSLRHTASAILESMGQSALANEAMGLQSLSELMARLVRERGTFQRELEQQKFALDQHAIVSITDRFGVIQYANDRFCEISGYTAEELAGQSHRLVKSGIHPPEFFGEMWRTISAGKVWHGEVCNRAKTGKLYWVAATIVPILDEHGRPRQYVGIRTDITGRKHMEEALRVAVERAEGANRAKSEFLATMSHEIRTPMNGIIGMTSLLLDTELSREQQHFANTVRSSAEALLSIINDILDFSKMEAGKLELEQNLFEVRPLVEGVVDILSPRIRGKDIELTYLVPSETRGVFRSDSGRLRQVLLNLAGNAVKFTEHGTVSIIVSMVDEAPRRSTLRIKVRDSGIGIPEAAHDRLFGTFTQADASTARRYGGSGLGLAICKRIVTLLGGEIGFESQEGQGSTFWFSVPLERTDEAPSDDLLENPLLGARILVVDDNETNREIFQHQLENWGAAVGLVDGAAGGLMEIRAAMARGHPYQVAILDHLMPGMSGLDLAAVLRADPSTASLPIVLASSADLAVVKEKAESLRLNLVLMKPVRQSSLLDGLMTLLGRSDGAGRGTVSLAAEEEADPLVSLKVLVAEDNAINQQVAVGLLTKLGHRADVADDGGEAVDLVAKGDYDLVLMDMQMPRVDGLAATRLIRALPPPRNRVAIIAMTANAMTGDRELCLAGGMDDYIAKPVDRRRLSQLLERWMEKLDDSRQARHPCRPPAVPRSESEAESVVRAEEPLIDSEAQEDLADTLGAESFQTLVSSFRGGIDLRLREAAQAVADGDGKAVAGIAHSLKGAASNLGFARLADRAAGLELAGNTGTGNLGELLQRLAEVAALTFPR